MSEEYYLQDSRSYVGNDMLFWADAGGYTTDVSKAEVWTKEDAVSQHNCRETDIPWPKSYIDAKIRPAVDMQYVNKEEALKDTGITLKKIAHKSRSQETYKCGGCGVFMSESQFWRGECRKCGCDNRP